MDYPPDGLSDMTALPIFMAVHQPANLNIFLHPDFVPASHHHCLYRPDRGPLRLRARDAEGVLTFAASTLPENKQAEAAARNTSKQECIWGAKCCAREATDSASQGSCDVVGKDHSGPWHLKTPSPSPESPSPAPDQEAVCVCGGKVGRGRIWIHVALMLDLDTFQKSSPYALVTEWIIQRYAGSRLICR